MSCDPIYQLVLQLIAGIGVGFIANNLWACRRRRKDGAP